MKRVLSLVLALVLVLGSMPLAFADEHMTAGDQLYEWNLIAGRSATEKDLDEEGTLTRAELMVLFAQLNGVAEEAESFELPSGFSDVAEDAWYASWVAYGKMAGWTAGYPDGTFKPTNAVSAQEMASFALNVLGYEVTWATAMEDAAALGINVEAMNSAMLTRGEGFAVMLAAVNTVPNGETEKLGVKLGVLEPEAPVVVVPEELEVVDVYSTNLKQVVVVFNKAVDEDSAIDEASYEVEGVTLDGDYIELSEDAKTVTITFADLAANVLENQEEIEVVIDGVYSEDLEDLIEDYEIMITPVDNTLPTVAEVNALGTKALEVVFSEPVQSTEARSTLSYKIDGKSISGSVKYDYPNSVIISTTLAVGDHTLEVKRVKDFNDFVVNETGIAFTVVEDKEAPEIVNVKTTDIKKAEIEFNEPVKSISKVYHTSDTSGNRNSNPSISSNKVTATFTNAMPVNGTTLYAVDVEDYSGNKATRSVAVTPDLDTTRPEVKSVKTELVSGNHKFTISFSESVVATDAIDGSNYTMIDEDGDKVKGNGLDANGHFISDGVYNSTDKKVVFTLAGALDSGSYTLDVSGIKDNSYIGNVMIPASFEIEIGDTDAPTLKQAWREDENTTSATRKYTNVFVRYSEEMATSGTGNVLDLTKYNYNTTNGGTWKPFPTDSEITDIGNNTIRISTPYETTAFESIDGVRVTLVSDVEENFISGLSASIRLSASSARRIDVQYARATAADEVTVRFNGELTNVDASDFQVVFGSDVGSITSGDAFELVLDSFSYASDNDTIAVFNFADSDIEMPADPATKNLSIELVSAVEANIGTQDAFGNKITMGSTPLVDKIAPSVVDWDTTDKESMEVLSSTATSATIGIRFDEDVQVNAESTLINLLTVEIDGDEYDVLGATAMNDVLTLVVSLDTGSGNHSFVASDVIIVELADGNTTAKALTDAGFGNAVEEFSLAAAYEDVN